MTRSGSGWQRTDSLCEKTPILDEEDICDEKKTPEESALILQKFFRRRLANKKYFIKELQKESLLDTQVDFIGNDPPIKNLKDYAAMDGQMVLIATSGMRSILLACELNANNKLRSPLICLIDHSKRAYELWQAMKDIAKRNESSQDFLKNSTLLLGRKHSEKLDFFNKLFNVFGFLYVRKIILDTFYLRQQWEDKSTFYKLNNILKLFQIKNKYVYASNIVACTPECSQQTILENIKQLEPKLSIHTNLNTRHHKPDKVYFCLDQSPYNVHGTIFALRKKENTKKNDETVNASNKFRKLF